MSAIHFFSEETPFVPKQKSHIREWVNETAKAEHYRVSELNFIFCTDEYLLSVNQQFLDHDTYTDIVTFDYSETEGKLHGDVFISIDRIRENAGTYGTDQTDELHRVIIHGVLHLCGYGDKKPDEKKLMTEREDHYLRLRRF